MSKFYLLGFFLLASCHGPVIGQSQDELIVDCIRKQNNFLLAKEGVVRVGFENASGTIKEYYETRKIRFQNQEEAKAYFLKIFERYIAALNADRRLKNHPFSFANTSMQIAFLDSSGAPLKTPYIAKMYNDGNTVVME